MLHTTIRSYVLAVIPVLGWMAFMAHTIAH